MALPDIDFKGIREHAGSRDRGFEELCCQLAALLPRSGGEFLCKGPGADAGGQETGLRTTSASSRLPPREPAVQRRRVRSVSLVAAIGPHIQKVKRRKH